MAPEENPPNDSHALPDPPSVPAINRQRHENRHSALRRTPTVLAGCTPARRKRPLSSNGAILSGLR